MSNTSVIGSDSSLRIRQSVGHFVGLSVCLSKLKEGLEVSPQCSSAAHFLKCTLYFLGVKYLNQTFLCLLKYASTTTYQELLIFVDKLRYLHKGFSSVQSNLP